MNTLLLAKDAVPQGSRRGLRDGPAQSLCRLPTEPAVIDRRYRLRKIVFLEPGRDKLDL
jgi:hypothetical protein